MVIQLVVIFVVIAGYAMNIVKLCKCDFKAPYKREIIHGVGVIPPVGVITGWLNISDEPDSTDDCETNSD